VVAGGDRREVLNAGATVLLLTRKTDYALVALVHLARRAEALVSARELAQRSHLPLPVLMNILNALAHCGLVRSVRGSRGGYRLARRPEDVTLADVIEAIEGPIGLTMCGSATARRFRAAMSPGGHLPRSGARPQGTSASPRVPEPDHPRGDDGRDRTGGGDGGGRG